MLKADSQCMDGLPQGGKDRAQHGDLGHTRMCQSMRLPSSCWLLVETSPLRARLPSCHVVSKQVVCNGFSMPAASGDSKNQDGKQLVAGDLHLG